MKLENKFEEAHVATRLSLQYELEYDEESFTNTLGYIDFRLPDKKLMTSEGSTCYRMVSIGHDCDLHFSINQKIHGPYNMIEVESNGSSTLKIIGIMVASWVRYCPSRDRPILCPE